MGEFSTVTRQPHCEQFRNNQLEVQFISYQTSKQGNSSQCVDSQQGSWPRKVGHNVYGHQLSPANNNLCAFFPTNLVSLSLKNGLLLEIKYKMDDVKNQLIKAYGINGSLEIIPRAELKKNGH